MGDGGRGRRTDSSGGRIAGELLGDLGSGQGAKSVSPLECQ